MERKTNIHLLIIDNYDSFTYNLYQMCGEILLDLNILQKSNQISNQNQGLSKNQLINECSPSKITVIRNDELTISKITELNPSHIILSPGPGEPKNAGVCENLIKHYYKENIKNSTKQVPILGVCLGHQAICEAFGAKIIEAKQIVHGKAWEIKITNPSALFENLQNKQLNLKVARYHSLAADQHTISSQLIVTSQSNDGEVMSVEAKNAQIFGVQFHPESILTKNGSVILKNFLTLLN